MDLNSEPRDVLERYGIKDPNEGSYARNCLLARRLVERDVRFVQLFHEVWDQHGSLKGNIKKNAEQTDQASAALVSDLKERGLLEDTVIIWGAIRTDAHGANQRWSGSPQSLLQALACGWTCPGRDASMARRTISNLMFWKTRSMCMIYMRHCFICWGSTIQN